MIDTQGRPQESAAVAGEENGSSEHELAALAEEMATYRDHHAQLMLEHGGQFVLIRGTELCGTFPDRSSALRDGYSRFGVVPFLVRHIVDPEPGVYLPNVVP
jgi:hypothetical protein